MPQNTPFPNLLTMWGNILSSENLRRRATWFPGRGLPAPQSLGRARNAAVLSSELKARCAGSALRDVLRVDPKLRQQAPSGISGWPEETWKCSGNKESSRSAPRMLGIACHRPVPERGGAPPPTDLSGSAACFCSQRRDGNPACILAQHP